ncbi:hypothetical protein ACFO3U_01615 [Flavobacterium ponti]|uniref:Outer membrane protein beta-barrel domain-containing protein n=1 Tax=Flavobacterium ponti TaxID=665133 RepID=A0ABV9NZA0_9FLAO
MKKILILLFLVASNLINAQSSEEEANKKVDVDFYFGVGAQFQSKFNLNDKLKAANLPELNETMPELQIGMNIFGNKISGDAEFGFLFSKNKKGDSENQNLGFTSRLRVHYNFVNSEKIAFTGGLNLAATGYQIDIYNKNNVIDLNDLEPLNNSGHVSLRNQVFFVGPSVSLYLFNNKSTKIRANLGYEFAFTNGKYKSDFASVENTVKENGNNRFVFGISFL